MTQYHGNGANGALPITGRSCMTTTRRPTKQSGVEERLTRRSHKPEIVGSNPTPATNNH